MIPEVVERLKRAGVDLTPGLADDEFTRIEVTFGFSFSSEHRRFLASAVPIGDYWVDWRAATYDRLRSRVDWPVDGVIFDVHNNDFWPLSWGARPADETAAERTARARLK